MLSKRAFNERDRDFTEICESWSRYLRAAD
jgi:hypothetical protein